MLTDLINADLKIETRYCSRIRTGLDTKSDLVGYAVGFYRI
jgi:hypothetical protein